jgi:hypothetical protein
MGEGQHHSDTARQMLWQLSRDFTPALAGMALVLSILFVQAAYNVQREKQGNEAAKPGAGPHENHHEAVPHVPVPFGDSNPRCGAEVKEHRVGARLQNGDANPLKGARFMVEYQPDRACDSGGNRDNTKNVHIESPFAGGVA